MAPRDNDHTSLGEIFEHSRLSRRQLLKRSMIFGLSVPAVASLLAACGDDDDDEPAATAPPSAPDPTSAPEETPEDEDEETPEAEVEETPDAAAEETPEAAAEETPEDEAEETPAAEAPAGEGVRGGTLRATLTGDLGTFDTQAVTQSVVGYVTWHIWEHLFTYDEDMQLTPELADTHEVSADALTHTFTLRDAMFHNGKSMTSEDVLASMNRWQQIAGTAGALVKITESLEATDEHTIVLTLTEPFGILTTTLARQNQGCVIFPSEIMEEIGTAPLTDYEHFIGTGPYRFVEHQPDRHILVERFDEYVSRQEESSGYAGFKHQYMDEIYFMPVTDGAASAAGLRAGDFHYVDSLNNLQYQPLVDDPNVTVEMTPAASWGAFVFNFAEGLCSGHEGPGLLLRQAILACLDMEEIALGAYGDGWYRLHPSVSFEGLPWETEAGGEFYNQANPDRARELMEEAGYNGEPIRWMTTREYQEHYDTTVLAVQQLEDVGFNIDLQIYDWATVGERRLDPSLYEMMTTGHTFRVDPVQLTGIMSASAYGFWGSPTIDEIRQRFGAGQTFEERFPIWEELQTLYYIEVPKMKVADTRGFHGMSANIRGWHSTVQIQPSLWNLWFEE